MTNQISKAREALEEILNTCDWPQSIIPEMSGYVRTIENIFDTLSSIDAERLGEALNNSRFSTGRRGNTDEEALQIYEAAAMLHGLVGGEE